MNSQSLLITLTNPPKIEVRENLLEDNVSTQIGGVSVFATVAPWVSMHDLLVEPKTQVLAGVVYSVAESERAAVAAICEQMPKQIIRYCVSPADAAVALRNFQFELTSLLRQDSSESNSVTQFPEMLRPYRQTLRSCLLGENKREELPPEILTIAAEYFDVFAGDGWKWSENMARVEVTWINKPVHPALPSHFPSAFSIESAQHFAEDVWFYRENNGELYAVGINYLSQTLDEYELRLPIVF